MLNTPVSDTLRPTAQDLRVVPEANAVVTPATAGRKQWFVLWDLTSANAARPAYKALAGEGLRVFTPLKWVARRRDGHLVREQVPFVHDLLFAHAERETLEPIIERMPRLVFRYVRGGHYKEAMVVADADMERFIRAVDSVPTVTYYLPTDIRPDMVGRRVRISGGRLDGMEGNLLAIRGSRKRRLIVTIPGFIAATFEVSPDLIRFL